MASPWLSVLKHVPWNEVIGHAPKVAEGARKLWGSVAGRAGEAGAAEPDAPPAAAAPTASPAPDGSAAMLAAFQAIDERLEQLGAAREDHASRLTALQRQLDALHEREARLTERLEAQQRRLRLLGAAAGVTALVALVALAARFIGA
ncbi:hypothetical protein [Piscinibacter sakaiensis]|uniref:Chemotaxis protein n=1 Tax=Piscinibacter sakaiensis TaxID=1547922 RepID=A0A0K8NX61_PISS1|nr:hypothetical protein [Piscinibacter sakaiensis]GAP34963.1 hypothetical protein ISF6_0513 [Piscinibacter sakaiensis]